MDEGKPTPPPRCRCGESTPGNFTVRPTKEPSRLLVLTMHEADDCPAERVVKAWWDRFNERYIAPMKAQWEAGRQLTCAIVGELPGRQIRFNKADAFEHASRTGFELVATDEEDGFVTIRAAGVEPSRIVQARELPRMPRPPLRSL